MDNTSREFLTNLLRRQTQRTDLGGKCRLSTNLTTGGTEVDNLHLIGIEFGSYSERKKNLTLAIAWHRMPHQGDDTYAWRRRKVVYRPRGERERRK